MKKDLRIIILAAGEGTRMKSDLPKVLHPLCGRPMISWVMGAAGSLRRAGRRLAVIGHGHEAVGAVLAAAGWEAVLQERRLGTGHAVLTALPRLEGAGGEVLVLNGDTPLLTAPTLRRLLAEHRRGGAPMTMLTCSPGDAAGYGRVVRDAAGGVEAIVEEKELAGRAGASREINAGVYVFEGEFLARRLPLLRRHAASGEYYLTDLAAAARASGTPAAAVLLDDPEEGLGVNTRRQLAAAGEVLRGRILGRLMDSGVTVVDPATTYVDDGVRVGRDSVLLPGTFLLGSTRVGAGCTVGPWARISSGTVGDGAAVLDGSVVEESVVKKGARIGPMAHLRPGSVIGEGARVGNFVEIKKSTLAAGVKASHLTYLGDATVGRGANVGAGTITCNYDGRSKHRTRIGEEAFIGSDTMLVAPVRVGRGAVIGAGSTITSDVPGGSLAVARAPQVVKKGWAARRAAAERGRK